jgi:hypothetical protein
MRSSDTAGSEVAPLLTADDMFVSPEHYWQDLIKKALTEYEDGEKVYGNFAMRKSPGPAGIPLNCYLDNTGNEKIYVEKLNTFIAASTTGGVGSTVLYYTRGFGLQSRFEDIGFENAVVGGLFLNADDFVEAFGHIGMDSGDAANAADLFSINGLYVISEYMEDDGFLHAIDTNLADYPFILSLIESYMTAENLTKLQGLSFDNGLHFILQDTIPYTGNAIKTEAQGRVTRNGNLAVWLGNKGVELRELYLTDPNLFTSYDSSIALGRVRNIVLDPNSAHLGSLFRL